MSNTLYKNLDYYTSLAHLLYAIAMADRSINRDEKLQIIAFTKKYFTKSIPEIDSQELIYKTLRELIANQTEAQRAFLVFSEYYFRNKTLFNNSLKSQILETCNAIATKKGKRSKMELILLAKLQALFFPKEF
ncbi:hypothetical protein [Pontimicrobium sp. MEBiC01747]